MSIIDRSATFRGNIVDHGVGKSTNGYPQWVASLVAVEIYDEDEEIWVDWTPYDVNEITSYQVLFGGKGETLAVQQIKKITGWDGLSFSSLAALDLSKTKIQFRVETNVYKEKTSLQVAWIDEYDAKPGRAIRKLDAGDLKTMDVQYTKFLKQSAPKTAPTKVPTKPKTPRTRVKAKGIESTQPKGPVKKKATDPLGPPDPLNAPGEPEPPVLPETLPAPPDPNLPTGRCTKTEAWEAVHELKAKNVTNAQIDTAWLDAIQVVAPGIRQPQITDEQWFQVREKVLDKTAMF